MTLKLPPTLASVEQLEGVMFELTEYLDWSRQSQIKTKVAPAKAGVEPKAWSAELQAILETWSEGKELTMHKVEDLMKELQHVRKTAPAIHLTLAAVPGVAMRQQFVTWFRDEIHPQVLLSFSANRTILGGMVLRAGSHIYDYSWRKLLLAKRDILPELVSHVRQ